MVTIQSLDFKTNKEFEFEFEFLSINVIHCIKLMLIVLPKQAPMIGNYIFVCLFRDGPFNFQRQKKKYSNSRVQVLSKKINSERKKIHTPPLQVKWLVPYTL